MKAPHSITKFAGAYNLVMCCAAIQKQAAVLSEESLAEREAARNGTAQRTSQKRPGKAGSGSSKESSMMASARESTYNLGVAAGLISETSSVSRAHSAALPRPRGSAHWNDKNARGRFVIFLPASSLPCPVLCSSSGENQRGWPLCFPIVGRYSLFWGSMMLLVGSQTTSLVIQHIVQCQLQSVLCRPIRSGIMQSAPGGGEVHGRGDSLRRDSFPASDSALSAELDLEAGLGTANRGGPAGTSGSSCSEAVGLAQSGVRHGMVLPFQPITLTFRDVHYSVDLPAVRSRCTLNCTSHNHYLYIVMARQR